MELDIEKLWGVAELAERTGLPRSWIYSKAEDGTLPHLKVGRHLRFVPSEIARWLEGRRRGPRRGAS